MENGENETYSYYGRGAEAVTPTARLSWALKRTREIVNKTPSKHEDECEDHPLKLEEDITKFGEILFWYSCTFTWCT